MPYRYVRTKIKTTIVSLLGQGITPRKIAISMTLGIVIGIFPIIGIPAIVCVIIAALYGLNHAVIQIFNWLAYPLQLILIIPFFRLGNAIFQGAPLTVTLDKMLTSYQLDFWKTIVSLWDITLHAFVAWGLVCIIMGPILYVSFLPFVKKLHPEIPEHPSPGV